ncbi:hypothetical protein Halha_1088 [Halobacteroides halobius DSM 5150]|uniref:Uncharacterized protein n=1 Tax=Halobacteroides halobius (strain ATCC 35273 / DSM 5150 / MD-1) TaxID=748449 RepID=L0K6Y6_HALHC|nr:hypothetical protein [Halobacteroides halobius]AGB41042.1 hypothetical protein Halha_1088 [Halobacteroides halobius DSM 5150]
MEEIIESINWSETSLKEGANLVVKEVLGADFDLLTAIENPKSEKSQQVFRVANQVMFDYMIDEDWEIIKSMQREIEEGDKNQQLRYKYIELGDFMIIARKVEPFRPRNLEERKKDWYVLGFCTYQDFPKLEEIYPRLKEELKDYQDSEWDLRLEVVGGLLKNRFLIDVETKKYWAEKGIRVETVGFDKEGGWRRKSQVVGKQMDELNKDVAKIKEKGGPTTLHEARLLKMKGQFNDNWLGQLNPYYGE